MNSSNDPPKVGAGISSRNFKVPAVVGLAPRKQKGDKSRGCKCRDELYHTSAKLGTLSLKLKIVSPSWCIPGLSRISFIMEPLPSSTFSLNNLENNGMKDIQKENTLFWSRMSSSLLGVQKSIEEKEDGNCETSCLLYL